MAPAAKWRAGIQRHRTTLAALWMLGCSGSDGSNSDRSDQASVVLDVRQTAPAEETDTASRREKRGAVDTETDGVDSEEAEIRKSIEVHAAFVEERTRPYRVRVPYTPRRARKLWNRFSRTKVCFHGPEVFSGESKYRDGMKLAYHIDETLLALLFEKLTSEKMTRVHLGPEINDAKAYLLALRLLEMRGKTAAASYAGPDRFISDAFARWRACLEEERFGSQECNFDYHVRSILFDDAHRAALIAYLKASAEKAVPDAAPRAANSMYDRCLKRYRKKGVNPVDAENWCGGQVGDSFGYGALNAARRTDEKFCNDCKAASMRCDDECNPGMSLGHLPSAADVRGPMGRL